MSKKVVYFLGLTLLAVFSAAAQMPGGGSSPGFLAALSQMFGTLGGFTAHTEISVLDKSQQELVFTPMEFSFLERRIRVEMDLSQARNRQMPPGMVDSLRRWGLANVVSIIRPDQKQVTFIYPDQKMLLIAPLDAPPKLERTPLGNETLDGHPCAKSRAVMTDAKGRKTEATVWNATDLHDFPIQIQTQEGDTTSLVRFSRIKFINPEAKQFEPPSGFQEYRDSRQFQQAMLARMRGEAGVK